MAVLEGLVPTSLALVDFLLSTERDGIDVDCAAGPLVPKVGLRDGRTCHDPSNQVDDETISEDHE